MVGEGWAYCVVVPLFVPNEILRGLVVIHPTVLNVIRFQKLSHVIEVRLIDKTRVPVALLMPQ